MLAIALAFTGFAGLLSPPCHHIDISGPALKSRNGAELNFPRYWNEVQ